MSWPTSCRQQAQLTIVDFLNGGRLKNPNHPAIGQPFPRQAQNQRLELPAGESGTAIARSKLKPPLVQSPVGQPDAVAIMHQHLQPGTASVGKEIGMVRLCLAEGLDDLGQDRFRARPHVERSGREP